MLALPLSMMLLAGWPAEVRAAGVRAAGIEPERAPRCCAASCRCQGCVTRRKAKALKSAMTVAERATGGEAVSGTWVRLPFKFLSDPQGVEVLVHMPDQDLGWRCYVDVDLMTVVKQERIGNPARPR